MESAMDERAQQGRSAGRGGGGGGSDGGGGGGGGEDQSLTGSFEVPLARESLQLNDSEEGQSLRDAPHNNNNNINTNNHVHIDNAIVNNSAANESEGFLQAERVAFRGVPYAGSFGGDSHTQRTSMEASTPGQGLVHQGHAHTQTQGGESLTNRESMEGSTPGQGFVRQGHTHTQGDGASGRGSAAGSTGEDADMVHPGQVPGATGGDAGRAGYSVSEDPSSTVQQPVHPGTARGESEGGRRG